LNKIKPQGYISPGKKGTAHIKNIIRQEVGEEEIPFILGTNTVILFNPKANVESIIRSLQIIIEEIKYRGEN